MTAPLPEEERQPRDAMYWAQEASVFKVERAPTGALNLNVEGHQLLSPLQGFGQLWLNERMKDHATIFTSTESVFDCRPRFCAQLCAGYSRRSSTQSVRSKYWR